MMRYEFDRCDDFVMLRCIAENEDAPGVRHVRVEDVRVEGDYTVVYVRDCDGVEAG